jgi:hypothetical protein
MAININPGDALRHIATFTSTGNFVVPAGIKVAFVSIHGSAGGGGATRPGSPTGNVGGTGGPGLVAGAFVEVSPGSTYAVTIGAGGGVGTGSGSGRYANATVGGTGGTSSFDSGSIFAVTGGLGGNVANAGTSGNIGATGAASGLTTLTALSPASAMARVKGITTQATGGTTGGTGGVNNQSDGRYGTSTPGASAGQGGFAHIYI